MEEVGEVEEDAMVDSLTCEGKRSKENIVADKNTFSTMELVAKLVEFKLSMVRFLCLTSMS